MVSGCDTADYHEAEAIDTVINGTIPQSTEHLVCESKSEDSDDDYKRILEVRLNLQEQVLSESKSLRAISDRLFEEEADLHGLIKSANAATLAEAIELFRESEGRYENLPKELWVAYSCFRRTLATKTQQLNVISRLERWQATASLEKLDDFIDNCISGPEIDQWLTGLLRNWYRDDPNTDTYKIQAINEIQSDLIFLETTCP